MKQLITKFKTASSKKRGKKKYTSLYALIWLVLLPFGAAEAAVIDDFWPLVIHADSTTWATVLEVKEGDHNRLLRLEVTVAASQQGTFFKDQQLLVTEYDGMSPEGMALKVGDQGLFLLRGNKVERAEFPSANYCLVNGGFLRGPFFPEAVKAIQLFLEQSDFNATGLKSLLKSKQPSARKLALSYAGSFASLPAEAVNDLRLALENESKLELQHSMLMLFMNKDLEGGQVAASSLLTSTSDALVRRVSMDYLEKHARPIDKAHLLLSYMEAPKCKKCDLLEACIKLKLPMGAQMLEEALLDSDKQLSEKAMRVLVEQPKDSNIEIYKVLILSTHKNTRMKAALGLAKLGSESACILLQKTYKNSQEPSFKAWLKRLMRSPYRFGIAPKLRN